MRKFLIPLLTASMLVPAAANAEDGAILRGMRSQAERSHQDDSKSGDRASSTGSSHRAERSKDDRPARVERAARAERQVRADRADRVERVDRVDRVDGRTGRVERAWREQGREQQVEPIRAPETMQPSQQSERRREGLAGAFSRVGRDMADGRTGDRDNDRDWRRDRDNRHRWSRDWRRDHRYDWYDYRNRYGSLFRLGRYYDPYGWGYRRFSIGFSLWPSYYGSSFWLDDPWQYRLPPAYAPYRWIRYYDDALLVNIYTGEVVDVIYNVFW